MKLAEALILRADTKKRFEQLRQRLLNNAKVQEGDKPARVAALMLTRLSPSIVLRRICVKFDFHFARRRFELPAIRFHRLFL